MVNLSLYDCARRILEEYAQDMHGYNRVAKKLTQEGWMFRDRKSVPRLIDSDDVRRVTSNWREDAGIVGDGRAKEKIASQLEKPSALIHDTGRAVFDLDLLRAVAAAQEKRSFTIKRAVGADTPAYDYALLNLVFCAHCERIAIQENNPKRRSRLHGSNTDKPRYRHTQGVQCGCKSRSIPADQIEADFFRLVNLLTLKDYLLASMLELAQLETQDEISERELEKQKLAAIAKLKRQIDAARSLFEDGDLTREEYVKRKEDRERQIAHWEARTTDYHKKAVELTTCMSAFGRLVDLWDTATGEERLTLARGLFESVVFDLDAKKIVDFRLHPWADQYLILRGDLYAQEETVEENKIASSSSDEATNDPIGTFKRICTHAVSRCLKFSPVSVQRCA